MPTEKEILAAELEAAVKQKLKITWDNEKTNVEVKRMIANAKISLGEKIALAKDDKDIFENEGSEQQLFLDYCLYIWNNVADQFERNYAASILQLRIKHEGGPYDKEIQDV